MNQHGIGLGLAISQKIITTLGGKISVSSKVDQGSVFKFTMKLETIKKE
jgi:signal transduction histidine kinase